MSGVQRGWAAVLPLLAAVAAIGAPLSSPRAEDFTFAERSIRLSVPSGWCRLDPKQHGDAAFIEGVKRMQNGLNQVVLFFADCQQLGGAHSGTFHGYVVNGVIMIPLQHGQIVPAPMATRAEFIDAAARELGAADMTKYRAELQDAFARAGAAGYNVDALKLLGVLKKDELGIYPGFLMPGPPQSSGKALMSVNALTMINHLPVSVVITRPADGSATMDRLLAEERGILDGLIAANATIEATAPKPPTYASGIDWNEGLGAGLIGAIVAMLLGALGYAAKRWRGEEADQG